MVNTPTVPPNSLFCRAEPRGFDVGVVHGIGSSSLSHERREVSGVEGAKGAPLSEASEVPFAPFPVGGG